MRERDLIPLLENITTRNLPVGDIWIGLSGEDILPGGLIIERKTVADLEASIKDGRYREQRLRLLTHCQETGARPLYIIEGHVDRPFQLHFQGNTLRKFLHRLQGGRRCKEGLCCVSHRSQAREQGGPPSVCFNGTSAMSRRKRSHCEGTTR
jgi:hypothetical protein